MKFGKKRSAPEPEPIDITQRLSILDLRAPAQPGAEAGSRTPPTASAGSPAPAPSDADALPARVAWKPTIYQPPAPESPEATSVPAEDATAPPRVVTVPTPAAPPEPAPAPVPPPTMPAHLADAARYEAEAFELPAYVPPPVEPEPTVAEGLGDRTPAERSAHHQAAAEEIAESAPAYDTGGSHELTTAELPPFEPEAGAGEPSHRPWTHRLPEADDESTGQLHSDIETATAEAAVEVPAARAADEQLDRVATDPEVDLSEPSPSVPEQVVDLTEAPEPVHVAAAADVPEPLVAERGTDADDGVIRWSW